MALKKDIVITYESGVTANVPNAYIKIDSYSGDGLETTYYVNTYLSQEARQTNKTPIVDTSIYKFSHDVQDGSQNVVKQGYEHLKLLPELVNAVDA